MKKLAVLGPKGTYSDIAAKKYISDNNIDAQIEYYPSILCLSVSRLKISLFQILILFYARLLIC